MRRALRIFAIAVLLMLIGITTVSQFRSFDVQRGPVFRFRLSSSGPLLVWVIGANFSFSAGWETRAELDQIRFYFLSFFDIGSNVRTVSIPWLWIVGGWGALTWGVWRFTRAKPMPAAFPVGETAPPP